MTKRTVGEIRAYLAEDMRLHLFAELAAVDLSRVLDAAVMLREALSRETSLSLGGAHFPAITRSLLAETEWLVDLREA